jgi:hypothetical protein
LTFDFRLAVLVPSGTLRERYRSSHIPKSELLAAALVQNGVNKPTILNPPKAYTVFILTFDF